MTLKIEGKKAIVAEVNKVAEQALSIVAAEYRGLPVSAMTKLRESARKEKVYLRVVRNTLAKRAMEDTKFACMAQVLEGPIVLAFSEEDPGAAARIVRDFVKDNDKFIVKGLSLGDKLLSPSQLSALANLPNREQALSQLLSVMKAPITKWVRTLTETYAMLARVTAAVRDQKQVA